MSVEERMKRLIADGLGVDDKEVVDNAIFNDDLGAEPQDLVELVKSAEEEFNIDLGDADVERLRTVRDAIEYVEAAAKPPKTAPTPHPAGAGTAAAPAVTEATLAAAGDDRSDTTVYKVVVNHEEQYSLWPADRELAEGWTATDKQGTKAECLAYIGEVWTDRRPLSLRKKIEGRE